MSQMHSLLNTCQQCLRVYVMKQDGSQTRIKFPSQGRFHRMGAYLQSQVLCRAWLSTFRMFATHRRRAGPWQLGKPSLTPRAAWLSPNTGSYKFPHLLHLHSMCPAGQASLLARLSRLLGCTTTPLSPVDVFL